MFPIYGVGIFCFASVKLTYTMYLFSVGFLKRRTSTEATFRFGAWLICPKNCSLAVGNCRLTHRLGGSWEPV